MTKTQRRQPQRRYLACQALLKKAPITRTRRRMTPIINVFTWTSSTCLIIGSTTVIPTATTPRNAHILLKEVDTVLVQGAVTAGAGTTRTGKPIIGQPKVHVQGTRTEATHASEVGPGDQVGIGAPRTTYTTITKATMSPYQVSHVLNQEKRGTKELAATGIRAQSKMTTASLRIVQNARFGTTCWEGARTAREPSGSYFLHTG